MSIPDRFYRIAKHKLGEIKDWFDKVDEQEDAVVETPRRTDPRTDARQELHDSLTSSSTGASAPSGAPGSLREGNRRDTSSPAGNPSGSSIPVNPPRTPQEIARGVRSPGTTSGYGSGVGASAGGTSSMPQVDPLDYHYRLLGLEPGADFSAVQAAYNKLAARCEPSRFPAGSSEERQARDIRQRLDNSYKQLREVLDTTATRFGLLEFDDNPRPPDDYKPV